MIENVIQVQCIGCDLELLSCVFAGRQNFKKGKHRRYEVSRVQAVNIIGDNNSIFAILFDNRFSVFGQITG